MVLQSAGSLSTGFIPWGNFKKTTLKNKIYDKIFAKNLNSKGNFSGRMQNTKQHMLISQIDLLLILFLKY